MTQYAWRLTTDDIAPAVVNTQTEQMDNNATPRGWSRAQQVPDAVNEYAWRVERTQLSAARGWTLWGNVQQVDQFEDDPIPPTPTGVTSVAVGSAGRRINWTSSGVFFTELELEQEIRVQGGTAWIKSDSGETWNLYFVFPNLKSGSTYRYRVRHRSPNGRPGGWFRP